MKKALESNSVLNSVNNVKEVEVRDMSKVEDITMNRGSIFSFMSLQLLSILCNADVINK